jgi:predicted Ser/Thr protein kinase
MEKLVVNTRKQNILVQAPEEEIEDLMRDWAEAYKQYALADTEEFLSIYRARLGLTSDADQEEINAVLEQRFGADGEAMHKFMSEVKAEYEDYRLEEPDWAEWFNERGYSAEQLEYAVSVRGA